MTITTDFYITGGTLPVNASSYVTRQADRELYDNLLRGQFCYVLNTRQMGKSSLMVRIAERLRAEGVDVVTLDLTAIGQNVTPQQWYEGLLSLVGEYFGREDALQQFWGEYKNLGPMQRFLWALQQAVLPHVERLVLFVDEIDAVRSLPFSTDEFFAGIRECHNRRAIDPVFHRLTFCLIGVATPSDLISNARISPFNIGKPILLTDFTSEEAAPLAEGLPGGQAVLEHVLYWTGGHPYMTQRLCRALAEYAVEKRIVRIRRRDVASLCCRLFLKQGACDTDDNLAFVRNRLLRSQADPAALLDFYKQVWLGRRVKDDETNQLCVVLKLSGVCRAEKGLLKVRNRIYTQVFDKAWVLRHMPYAELRRQRAAYRAGVLRTSLIGSAFVGLVGALAVTAVQEAHLADVNRSTAMEAMRRETQRSQASDKALVAAKRALYVSNVALAAQVWQSDDGPASTVQKLLASCDPPVDPSLLPTSCELLLCYDNRRGFDGLYVASRLIHTSVAGGFGAPGDGVQAIFTPEEDILMLDGDARLHRFQVGPRQRPEASRMVWNAVVQSLPVIGDERDPPLALKQRYAHFIWARLAQDGRTLEVGLTDGSVRVLDARSRAELGTQRGVAMPVQTQVEAADPQGRIRAVGDDSGVIRFEAIAPQGRIEKAPQLPAPIAAHNAALGSLAWSCDGKLLASGARDGLVRVWEASTHRRLFNFKGHLGAVTSVQFSKDGKRLLSGSTDGTARLWKLAPASDVWVQEHEPNRLIRHMALTYHGLFACTNGEYLSVQDTMFGKEVLRRSGTDLSGLACAPDSNTLVYADTIGPLSDTQYHSRIHCLDIATGQERWQAPGLTTCQDHWQAPGPSAEDVRQICCDSLCYSPDGKWIACGFGAVGYHPPYENSVCILDAATGRLQKTLRGFHDATTVLFSPDGYLLAVACRDKSVHMYATRTWTEITAPLILPKPCLALAFAPSFRNIIPNSRLLAIGGNEGLLVLQECTSVGKECITWGERHTLEGHTGMIGGLAFSANGATLASASWDRTVRLWYVANQRETLRFSGAASRVNAITFFPGGRTLAAGDGEGHVRFWGLDF